jgi:hypothetical protein
MNLDVDARAYLMQVHDSWREQDCEWWEEDRRD